MTTMIKTTLERELYDALQALNTAVHTWFDTRSDVYNAPLQFQLEIMKAQKAIDKADGKKMGKIEMIKHARAVSNLGLKEAKDLVELILQNAPKEDPMNPGYDHEGFRI